MLTFIVARECHITSLSNHLLRSIRVDAGLSVPEPGGASKLLEHGTVLRRKARHERAVHDRAHPNLLASAWDGANDCSEPNLARERRGTWGRGTDFAHHARWQLKTAATLSCGLEGMISEKER